jgi:hypothetical protein
VQLGGRQHQGLLLLHTPQLLLAVLLLAKPQLHQPRCCFCCR